MDNFKIGILALEDDLDDLTILKRALSEAGCEEDDYELFQKVNDFKKKLNTDPKTLFLIILDYYLNPETGLEVLKMIRQISPGSYVISFTGMKDPDIIIKYVKTHIDDWVEKKINFNDYYPELVISIKQGIQTGMWRAKLYGNLQKN